MGQRRRAALMAALIGGASAAAAQAECGDGLPKASRQLIQQQALQLAFAPRPAPLPLGRHFALDIVVCPAAGQPAPVLRAVDAEMPAHRHGMNYRPTVQALGPGQYRADGLLLHMPGAWRLWFELDTGPGLAPLRLAHDLTLR